jgi:MFS family permease
MVFGNRHLWPMLLMSFGLYGAFATFIQNWIVIYLMQVYSFPRDFAANFALIAAISHVIGPGFSGVLSDKLLKQRRLPVMLCTGTLLASFLVLTFWNGGRPPVPSLYIICFVMGLGTSAIPIMFASVRELVYPSVRGLASGLVNMGLFVGAAITQPLFGYILDMNWQGEMIDNVRLYPLHAFHYGLIFCCILALIGFIGAMLMKETYCREIYGTSEVRGR